MKKKILVTGANGYIGKNVVKFLLDSDYEVTAIDINFDRIDERAKKVNIDIFNDAEDIVHHIDGIDTCIHLAWRNGFVHNSITHLQDISSHYEFLEKLSKNGVKNINVIGTMHEIGYWEGEYRNQSYFFLWYSEK